MIPFETFLGFEWELQKVQLGNQWKLKMIGGAGTVLMIWTPSLKHAPFCLTYRYRNDERGSLFMEISGEVLFENPEEFADWCLHVLGISLTARADMGNISNVIWGFGSTKKESFDLAGFLSSSKIIKVGIVLKRYAKAKNQDILASAFLFPIGRQTAGPSAIYFRGSYKQRAEQNGGGIFGLFLSQKYLGCF